MGIHFTIHTYGYFDAMFLIVNGIKMIMDSPLMGSLINLMAMVSISYYSILIMVGASSGRSGVYFAKSAGMVLMIVSLLYPKADMLIVDRISGKKEVVTGLPYAFVLPVGTLEALGAGITATFEQVFAPVSSAPFKDYGMIFGQRLVQESKNWKIANPEFIQNMDGFIERCIVIPAMIGVEFTPSQVYGTNDIFDLVTSDAGTFRKVAFTLNGTRRNLTCKEAGKQLKAYMGSEMGFLSGKYQDSAFSIAGGGILNALGQHHHGPTLNQVLARNIEIGYRGTLGVDAKAEDIVRQNMMINALKDFNRKSDLYGYTRASDSQKSSWVISGELAKVYLPMLLNIIKGLIYTSFIFMVPLMILAGGMGKYMKYCVVIFSLQIWPALNSVLNLFIELYSNVSGASITGGVLSYSVYSEAHESVDTIVALAGYLQMSIPFLSFAIVQGGVGSFVHLASSIQSASQSAASMAASEVTSGNRGFDNISNDNQSQHNKSGFKTDLNALHQQNATQVQGANGSIQKTFADGSSSISTGAGINQSSGTRSLSIEESAQVGLQEHLGQSTSAMQGAELGFTNSRQSTIGKTSDLVSHIAQRESAGENFSYDKMGEQGESLKQAVQNTKALRDQNGWGWDQASSASVTAYADGGLTLPVPGVKAETGVKVDGSVRAENNSEQSLAEEQNITRANDTDKTFNNLVKAASNEQWMQDNSIDTSYAENTKASYDEMQSFHETATQKREEVDTYSSALQASQNTSASDRKDMYHELEEGVMRQYGVSQDQAHQMIEIGDKRANKVWDGMVQSHIRNQVAQVQAGKQHVNNVASRDASGFYNEHSDKVNDQGLSDIKAQATNAGLSQDILQNNIANTHTKLGDNMKTMTQENNDQIHSVQHASNIVEQDLRARADKYEEDRIGQGRFAAPIVGGTANLLTVLNAGALNVGGPSSKDKLNQSEVGAKQMIQNTQGNIKSLKPSGEK